MVGGCERNQRDRGDSRRISIRGIEILLPSESGSEGGKTEINITPNGQAAETVTVTVWQRGNGERYLSRHMSLVSEVLGVLGDQFGISFVTPIGAERGTAALIVGLGSKKVNARTRI